jgi:hypothetical protein
MSERNEKQAVRCTEMSEVLIKEGEDVLLFVSTLLYWDSVCWMHHFITWWADYMYVGRALFEERLGCRIGVQPHN